jgi:polysaccharide biosynthesis transport protein
VRTGLRAGWIRRRWWVLVLAVVAATAIGALVASVRPGSYQASLIFVVKSTSEEISPDGAQRLASTYAALLPEDDLIARAIGKAVNRPPREVKKRLTAINPIDTALVRATYEGSTRAEALAGMAALQDAITSARPASPAVRSRSILPVQAATVTTPSSALISIVLAALLGFCAGAVLVIALERSDVRVDDPATLMESVPDIPVLGTVPPLGRHTATPVQSRPFSPAAEGFQGIRLALERIGFGSDFHVLVVMSADKQEGKSTLAANLGMALARQARAVLLISGDMRTPQLEKLLGVTPSTGWAELLVD